MNKKGINPEANDIVIAGSLLVARNPQEIDRKELMSIVRQLISICDGIYLGHEVRESSVEILAKLASKHEVVLDIVIENAKQYAYNQHIDDSFPYSPNGFDILLKMKPTNKKVISFLEEIVRNDWGIPRWKAIEVLCQLNDLEADRIISNVIEGMYKPKHFNIEPDIEIIKQFRRNDFLMP